MVEQLLRILPLAEWENVHVCCSGSFRVDRAIKAAHPDCSVFSNDVSLLSCALGALAMREGFHIQFKGRLEFVEQHLQGGAFADRVAAVLVALQMAGYKGESRYAREHFAYYVSNFEWHLRQGRELVQQFQDKTQLAGFFAGDFRDHAELAIERGAGIIAFPPTYKGGYERLYKFVDQNTEWTRPNYRVFDPKTIEAWVTELADRSARYCVFSDQRFEGLKPTAHYYPSSNRPIFLYASEGSAASVKRARMTIAPFAYKTLVPEQLTAQTRVELAPASSAQMNFLKECYLAKVAGHTSGHMNFVVLLDGMLAGGFIFAKNRNGQHDTLYLLSDFSVSRANRLSKLIATLATSRQVIGQWERKYWVKITRVLTTAFTDKPVSMKYRGVFELASRKPGMLNYSSAIREASAQQLYDEWFARHAENRN